MKASLLVRDVVYFVVWFKMTSKKDSINIYLSARF